VHGDLGDFEQRRCGEGRRTLPSPCGPEGVDGGDVPPGTVPASPRSAEGRSVPNVALLVVIALLVVLAAPLWPWSRGWTWAPAVMLLMGLATMLLFTWTVVPE
jgi:hypothetical protein